MCVCVRERESWFCHSLSYPGVLHLDSKLARISHTVNESDPVELQDLVSLHIHYTHTHTHTCHACADTQGRTYYTMWFNFTL